ncbi:MAG: hypothetical protein QN187_14815 [Armatimonadota bacterium]|nr:hypothetical protein [Armatimonadota bacterium]MDR7520598.1 hypothetical protein [Armatimonadota bacterium]MDR7548526.1 hypothetical protein [Armatimonadota bacterium]
MARSIAQVLALVIFVLLAASMIVFALINLPPGDPAQELLGHAPWVEDARAINEALKDRPVVTRYVLWLARLTQRVGGRARSGTEWAMPLGPDA